MGLQVYALQEGASADRRQAILDPCSAGASADRGSRSYMLFEATRSRKSKVFKPYVKHRAAFLLVHDSKPLGDARRSCSSRCARTHPPPPRRLPNNRGAGRNLYPNRRRGWRSRADELPVSNISEPSSRGCCR
jgi:hypothetical protein